MCPTTSDEADSTPTDTGYSFSGIYDLAATLDRTQEGWVLDGSFTFPTSGYTVIGPEIVVLESFPEQVIIEFTVIPPAPDEIVLQVITMETFNATIDVSDQATFTLTVNTLDPLF